MSTSMHFNHAVWENYMNKMEQSVQEYSDCNNLNLNKSQVKELSIYNTGQGANIYDNYVKDLSKKNGTTVEKEQAQFTSRIDKLTKE